MTTRRAMHVPHGIRTSPWRFPPANLNAAYSGWFSLLRLPFEKNAPGPNTREGLKMTRPPVPPFTYETATQKVRLAEDGWNSKRPEKVALAYTPDCVWRNRASFVQGRDEIIRFLTEKWSRELDYRLIKELWAFTGNRIAVRFAYEWHDDSHQWFRSYGNENWEFYDNGLMQRRIASINDLPISKDQRLLNWSGSIRPNDHRGLSALGL